jgi:hypothetical protein
LAIVQISQITNRKGLAENLPQLAGAELGWATDTRQLYIGNGTLEDGAPVIGNTEILTEFSDLFQYSGSYTYKGSAAGYDVQTGPTPGSPVSQSLQSRLDSYAVVTDFGAVGDGVTDDTEAINRALYQLFCRNVNPQIRRSLFFPAGVYRVIESIVIPPYATLYGEGSDNSIIRLDASPDDSALRAYVARTGDSLQQTGANIGNQGAITPQYISVSNMGFESLDTDVDIFLVDSAINCTFNSVSFAGPLTATNITSSLASYDTAAVRFNSTPSLVTSHITFDKCSFSNVTYGTKTDEDIQGIVFSNSDFNTLYQGIYLDTAPTGVRVTNNTFDTIYAQGLYFTSTLCASSCNIFYDVGNHFLGTTSPHTSVVFINANENVSIGDMFQRSSAYAGLYPRIDLNNTTSIGITSADELALGTYVRETGKKTTLVNNTSSATAIFTVDALAIKAFKMEYTITRGSGTVAVRTGTYTVVASTDGTGGTIASNDTGYQNTSTGVTFSVSETASTVSVKYTTTNTGNDAELTYSISHLA